MAILEWIISIVLFVVAFGVLITIHEFGHFSMAKAFGVYCHEFSIGFGPTLFKKRRKGKETYFSLRAIPLGGYVSMYGEEGQQFEEGLVLSEDRSIEGIKKWKKAIVVSAGVILNAILAFILIAVSNIAFPTMSFSRRAHVTESSLIANAGIKNDDLVSYIYPSTQETETGGIMPFSYEFTDEDKIIHGGSFFIVDTETTYNDQHYVLAFMFMGNKNEPNFSEGLKLYEAVEKSDLNNHSEVHKMFYNWSIEEGSPNYYPNFEKSPIKLTQDLKISANLHFLIGEEETEVIKTIQIGTVETAKGFVFEDIGLNMKIIKHYLPLKDRIHQTFVDYGDAATAVFKGLGTLLTGGIKNMSGIVGIFETSANLYSNYTFATYLYFWGLISVNLAIFNLLPFPGLDGWQLLVTVIEGVSHKKIPTKVKSIVSFIGLALLFILMMVIIVMDFLKIFGI